MKFLKVAIMAAVALAWSSAYAFHSGGVAECEGCHTMHNSFEGSAMAKGPAAGPYLLKAQDQSGACLNCHESADTAASGYHISTAGVKPYDSTSPVEATPGGDFAWLKKTRTYTVRKAAALYDGERNGHNVIAADFGYSIDKVQTVAPGGTYPAANLACSSCHDPHGRTRRLADGSFDTTGLPIVGSGSYNSSADPSAVYAVGAYRILGGLNYAPKSYPDAPFANQVPDAVAPSTYNRYETSQATQTFVAYGQGMSEWCANCHTNFLRNDYVSGMKGLTHPAGNAAKLPDFIVSNYNAYVTSGVMTGTGPTAFSTLTPFEIGTNDYTVLKPWGSLSGTVDRSATTTNNVACVSCHRAHASGFESSLRFFYLNEFSTIGDATGVASYDSSTTENKINYGLDVNQQTMAYNGRPAAMFGPWARKACNKCHAKD